MRYQKDWLSFDQQADLLMTDRGLISDKPDLIRHLQEVGYYRLSGYWYIFKRCNSSKEKDKDNRDERFVDGTTFDAIWNLYTFDRQLRLLTLDAIERIEVYLKTQLAYELANDTGVFGYLEHANLPNLNEVDYKDFIDHCKSQYDRSREPYVHHFKQKYGDAEKMPPYWMMVNIMDFGTLSRLYRGSPTKIQKSIAAKIGIAPKVLNSWLVSLNTIRNICAHHGRLWNRGIGTRPIIPSKKKHPEWHEPIQIRSDNMFGIFTIFSFLLQRIAPDTSWRKKLFALIKTRSDDELTRMGFVNGWNQSPFWKPWTDHE